MLDFFRNTQLLKKLLTGYLKNNSMEFGQFSLNGLQKATKFLIQTLQSLIRYQQPTLSK